MAASRQEEERITAEGVRRHLEEKVFVTTPSSYYAEHPRWPGLVGLEIEAIPVHSGEKTAPPRLVRKSPDLEENLTAAAAALGWSVAYDHSNPEHPELLSINLGDQDQLTFEPGGQLEISTRPYPCLSAASDRLMQIQAQLQSSFSTPGYQLTQIGMNPWYTVEQIGLQMRKPRYHAMTRYFGSINGGIGLRMMRQTCTIQVNLDFGPDEETLAKRYVAAQVLAPIAGAIFAYSPFWDGAASQFLGARAEVWQRIDPTRTGLQPMAALQEQMSRAACIRSYFDFLLDSQVVFVTGADYAVPEKPLSWRNWLQNGYHGIYPGLSDLKTSLSLLFPEVRPRGFLELRSIDCQARPWQLVPAAFYCSLLYDGENLDNILALGLEIGKENGLDRLRQLSRFGLRESELATLAKRVTRLALEGFERLPECFRGPGIAKAMIAFYEHFTENGQTPADGLVARCLRNGVATPRLQELQSLEDEWFALAT